MTKQIVMLGNLSCPSCAAKLEKAVGQLAGVKSAKVAFGSGALHVEYDETQASEAAVRKVVGQLGLEVIMVL
jgi:copper chaperone